MKAPLVLIGTSLTLALSMVAVVLAQAGRLQVTYYYLPG
jgi:hypothetical protein